ncbi:leucine-rich repeat receptor-like tyrosine-protein kinase PXC3 [Nicotiana tomentosiformis]|uniref:leucine-rich repeat receptor-like tyrosine-protein kinase PXC3 n=1 Tax=Nicotiana tomentosiformis TaxID=4098 RepID=UPI00051C788A|nr:leucine-rich repeat receptor-like tyrosine-protein kinase PXC3 [Nicotiana tomentosiformis]
MNLRYVPHIAYIVIFLSFPLQLVFSQLPTDQINTMRKVYDMLQNDTATSFVWDRINKSSNPCSWKGISCNSNNSSITKVSFSLFSISSSDFLPVICQINTLESLDISQNHLSSIPSGFITGCGGISGLKLLNFSRNKLEGSLPTFTGFGKLDSLDFSHNKLNGKVDLQLGGLNLLKSLNLSYNNFSGSVPTSLGKFNLLEELQLSANSFQGEFPTQIVNFGNFTLIDLSLNFLSGVIPDRLGELSKLQVLILSANNLSGTIPQSIGNIKTLTRFAANQNRFVGNIPLGLTKNLRNLDLSFNNLTGIIPQDLLSPMNLQFVDLTSNKLEGPVPTNLSINLIRLRLGDNALNGSITSASFGSLQSLTYLELDKNQLSGPIPSELGKCQNLALLNLAQNKLSGVIPVELGDISNLQVLSLQSNNLVGDIPSNISQLNRLQRLNISWNSLNGTIPSSISSLKNLTNLNLQGNKLSGQIPPDISNLNLLLELQLGGNQLGGAIPAMPLSLQIALNLSHNLFEGPIPITLSRLTSLEVLDLSYNRFSGQIPDFLTRMGGLTRLVLSDNQLSGIRPEFGSFVIVETSGNRGLIYPSPITPPEAAKKRKSIVIAVVVPIAGVAVIALFTLIAISISRRYYRINDDHFHSGEEGSQSPVIQGKVLTANSIHKSNIDFTKAMVAVSDPLNVVFKTRFSTYYKAVMPSGTTYFVKKLNWSDKIFQLGSHELFGEELKNLGKLNNSNIVIPLGYLLAADSAYLFYEFSPIGTLYDVLRGSLGYSLDWASRYSIAIGVAQGLAFLHGYNSGPILLLDLSSKSVLLKSQNEAQIGDIELYKVIDPSKSTGSFSAVAGSVGYIPPEYAYTMRVTMAGNVYSFGVVLLELLTGRPAVSQGTELAKSVLSDSEQHNKWDHILDSSICKTSLNVRSQMLAVLKVALVCVSISPEGRPKMKSVLRMLLNAR